jgi:Holliday junction resolvase RusA-like endonuclease
MSAAPTISPCAFTFEIPGRLGGKGRPRFRFDKKTQTPRTYTPPETHSREAEIKWFAQQAMGEHPILTGPVKLTIFIQKNVPTSWTKKKRARALYVTGTPDFDNTIKLICDSLNHIIWHSDAQVCDVAFARRYALIGPEFTRVTIEALGEGP